jgi:preprotein translocase subunit SecE
MPHFQIFKFSNFQIHSVNKISNYFKESYHELLQKVTWPSWSQLQQSTVIVLVATVIITAMVWVMDFSSNQLLKLIYSLFK